MSGALFFVYRFLCKDKLFSDLAFLFRLFCGDVGRFFLAFFMGKRDGFMLEVEVLLVVGLTALLCGASYTVLG